MDKLTKEQFEKADAILKEYTKPFDEVYPVNPETAKLLYKEVENLETSIEQEKRNCKHEHTSIFQYRHLKDSYIEYIQVCTDCGINLTKLTEKLGDSKWL